MNINYFTVLVIVAMVLSIIALIKPAWPLCPIGLLLVCVALLAKNS